MHYTKELVDETERSHCAGGCAAAQCDPGGTEGCLDRSLDGKLAETLGVDAPAPSWPEDAVLLVPPPCDNVYELYLCAMIDFADQETGLYANDMAVFNAAVREARAWWRRHDCPRQSGNWRVM